MKKKEIEPTPTLQHCDYEAHNLTTKPTAHTGTESTKKCL